VSGLLQRAIAERRAQNILIGNPQDPAYWIQKLFLGAGGGPATSGVDVTPATALSWTAISAGVRISGETLGSLPWSVFEYVPTSVAGRPGDKIERTNHPLYFLLHSEPNEEQTSMEFLEMAQSHALWFGGSASQIVRDNAGIIRELWPLSPDRCRWERDPDGSLWLRVTLPAGQGGGVGGSTMLPAREVLWVRGFSTNGIYGASLPEWHREAIGLGLATELFIAGFFGRGLSAGGILEHPKTVSKEAQARIREAMDNQVGGLDRAHRLLILEEGMKWTQTTIDPQKAELLGLRQFQIAEASRILRIPPHMLGDLTRGTFSNNEQQAIEFVQNHVRPWTVRWEQRCNKQLFGRKEKGRLYVKANMNALARGDMQARFTAYQVGIASRVVTPNECRENEDLNPGPPDLDQFQVSPNLNPPKPAMPGTGGPDGQDPGVAEQPAAA
jgi:HK97 family phage portal protein